MLYGYDTMGRLISVDGPWANDTITYSYDALGRRSAIGLDGNTTYYDYDNLSRLSEVTNGSNVFGYSYNGASDQLNAVTLPNGTESTFSYDSLGRLSNVHDKVSSSSANISNFTYGYDNRDVQTSVQRALGTGATQTINYTYDNIDQLIGEISTEPTPLLNNSYSYDAAGNRTAATTNGTESTFTLDQMNQISGYTLGGNAVDVDYDDNGNTIQIGNQFMAYDDADRLTSVIQVNPATQQNIIKTEYVYDGLSRRNIARTYSWDAGNETWIQQSERRFIYDGMDLIQERDGNNNVIASYVRDGNIGGALSRTTANGTFYYHYDGNGNVVAMTNISGIIVAEYTYDAYGNLVAMSGSEAANNPIRFSTKYFDGNTSYYDFGFRSYDPVTGRWLNRDPIGEEGGLNLYGFVGNSPGNVLDAYGLNYWKSIESWVNEQLYGKPSKPVNSNEPGADTWALAQSKARADRRGIKVSAKLAETGMRGYGEAAGSMMTGSVVKGAGLAACGVRKVTATGLKGSSSALRELFEQGTVRGKTIIFIRSRLLKGGFVMSKARGKGYLFKNKLGEEVRIMSRAGGWDIRIRNRSGNYLDEFGNVATPQYTHKINAISK